MIQTTSQLSSHITSCQAFFFKRWYAFNLGVDTLTALIAAIQSVSQSVRRLV